jgi:hypothetical protein
LAGFVETQYNPCIIAMSVSFSSNVARRNAREAAVYKLHNINVSRKSIVGLLVYK